MTAGVGLVALAVAAVVVGSGGGGCGGDDDASRDDAGVLDAGAIDAGMVAAAPAPPAIAPCPEGWRVLSGGAADDASPDVCEPWPETGRATCTRGDAHFPGTPACAPVGTPCPVGDFADDLPTSGVRFVSDDAAAAGVGTRAAPFSTIAEALVGASSGTIVALAKGDYDEIVTMPLGVELRGACSAETRVRADALSIVGEGVLNVRERGVVVRDITVSGAREGIVVSGPRGALELSGVVIESVTRSGIRVGPNASLTGVGVAVGDISVAEERYGYGIAIGPGSTVMLTRVSIEHATSSAIAAFGAQVTLEDAVLADTEAQPFDGRLGSAIEAIGGAVIVARRVVMEGNQDRALHVYQPGTNVTLEDAIVRGTRARPRDGGEGRAAFVYEGAALTLRRTLIEDNRDVALLATDADAHIDLEDVVVRATLPDAIGEAGSGLALQDTATARLTRVLFDQNRGISLVAFSGSVLSVADVDVARTESQSSDGRFGDGVHVESGARIEGARLRIRESRGVGLVAIDLGSAAMLEDVRVETTRERTCSATTCPGLGFGDGVVTAADATIEIARLVSRGNARAGVHVGGGAIDLHEGLVEGNPIGAAIQVPGFDAARLNDGVIYRDNVRNLDMTALPLPEPSAGF